MKAEHRLVRLREALRAADLGGVLVGDPVDIAYLTGFDGVFDDEDAHVAIVTAKSALLFTDSRYAAAASSAAEGTAWDVVRVQADLYAEALERANALDLLVLAVQHDQPYRRVKRIEQSFAGEVRIGEGLVGPLRTVKDAEELARIEAAQRLTDAAFEHILGYITEGMSERRIALELEFHMRENGSEGVAFPPIVASGPNSALPHAKVTDRVVVAGEFLKMDFGARVGGYCADMTRTVVVGSASDHQRDVYSAVLAANEAGIAAVAAGREGRQIDTAARDLLAQRGYGELFGHGLGHGVGLQVHEAPGVGPRSDKPVPAGSVITIEPGVYEPGVGGVRIEDLVVVEEGGCRVLTRSPKNLIEL